MRYPALLLAAALAATPASADQFEAATAVLAARPLSQLEWLVINLRDEVPDLFAMPGLSSRSFLDGLRMTRPIRTEPITNAVLNDGALILSVAVEWHANPTAAECVDLLGKVRDDLVIAGKENGPLNLKVEAQRAAAAGRLMEQMARTPSSPTTGLGPHLAAGTKVSATLLDLETPVVMQCAGSLTGRDFHEGRS